MIKLVFKVIGSLLVLLPVSVWLHECGHWLAGYYLYGLPGRLDWFINGRAGQITWPDTPGIIAHYAGGLFAFLILGALYFGLRKQMPELSIVALVLALQNLGYGIYEGASKSSNHNLILPGVIMLTIGLIIWTIIDVVYKIPILEKKYVQNV